MSSDSPFVPDKANYFTRYVEYARAIITSYKGNEPFHIFLKKYFASNKKHGSRDRKIISSLCYNYFRVGHGVSDEKAFEEKLFISTFLCENNSSAFLEFFKPGWNTLIQLSINEKLAIVDNNFTAQNIFFFSSELSNEIDVEKFNRSFLIQPLLFIRTRPGFRKAVFDKLTKAGFLLNELSEDCISLNHNEKVTNVLEADKEAVIQDYNSQKTLDYLKEIYSGNDDLTVWDCCAGSGGKSILAHDLFKRLQLTVSDRRKNILKNLEGRFLKAGLKNYKLIVADLEKPVNNIDTFFDLIIADVPCSGSGTWSRTPEQLTFFLENDTNKYAVLQQKIIENALPRLKSDGHLLYITCSVFKKENEDNVAFIQQKLKLNLIKMEYLKGFEMQADTLFVALFKKINA